MILARKCVSQPVSSCSFKSSKHNFKHILCSSLATVPSSSKNIRITGQCTIIHEHSVPRHVPLSPSILMPQASTEDLRDEFLRYFYNHRHKIVAPASIFPKRNEGSYFINAGMNQFKSLILGQIEPGSQSEFDNLRRATNSQPCIRVGGRHDDLNDVGYDGQHHTVFEMLGNWSFGDYDKTEACRLMWNFVTGVLGLPANAIYVTYFGGCSRLGLPPDDETRNIWLSLGVIDQKLMPFGMESNFWRASQSSGAGLCGPSTELHVDFRALMGGDTLQCARCLINTSSPQIVELWNCVFITHRIRPSNQQSSTLEDELIQPDSLEPLSKCFIDTGMGLERLASVMQGVTSTYDSDVFTRLVEFIESKACSSSQPCPSYQGIYLPYRFPKLKPNDNLETKQTDQRESHLPLWTKILDSVLPHNDSNPLCGRKWAVNENNDSNLDLFTNSHLIETYHRDTAYRIMTDHSRALAYALSDGLLPGRQGLALKVRQLIHRATRASILSGLDKPDLDKHSIPLLACLVAEVAKFELPIQESLYNVPGCVRGPSSRGPSRMTPKQMETIVAEEIHAFIPRLWDLEKAFELCLKENPNVSRLSTSQTQGLLNGKYGSPVSWDLVCAQSRWAGLYSPNPIQSSSNPDSHGKVNQLGRFKVIELAFRNQLESAQIPFTNDSWKYSYHRCSDKLDVASCDHRVCNYDFPELETNLVGVFLPTNIKDHYLFHTELKDSQLQDLKQIPKANRVGLIFRDSNFYASAGGQDSDTGIVKDSTGVPIFKVDEAVHLTDSLSRNDPCTSWILHWGHFLDFENLTLSPNQTCILAIDPHRRFDLMSHHTGLHLFSWALESELQTQKNPAQNSTFQQLHTSVHPDHFSLEAALVQDKVDSTNDTSLAQLIHRVEQRCRQSITKGCVVSTRQVDWDVVTQNPNIRYQPWEQYGNRVRAVCVSEPNSRPTSDWSSIESVELCSGTHLFSLADLSDIVITSVMARRQTIKHFTGVVGQTARDILTYGHQLVEEAKSRQAQLGNSTHDLQSYLGWLESVIGDQKIQTQLPVTCRIELQQLLDRMTQTRLSGSSASESFHPFIVDRLTHLYSNTASKLLVAHVEFGKLDDIILALVKLSLDRFLVVYDKHLAVCYFSNSDSKQTALQLTHQIAQALNFELNKFNLVVKARPVRSVYLENENRFKLATLQLLSLNKTESVTNPNWDLYHDSLLGCANHILFNPKSSVDLFS